MKTHPGRLDKLRNEREGPYRRRSHMSVQSVLILLKRVWWQNGSAFGGSRLKLKPGKLTNGESSACVNDEDRPVPDWRSAG
jgi:hypothetical protein